MADAPAEMKPTLGLTGLTMNAMALIAPGAFLWLTFAGQAAEEMCIRDSCRSWRRVDDRTQTA